MTEPYPSAELPPELKPQPPATVRTAAWFMYAGALITLAGAIIQGASVAALRASIHRVYPQYTATQVRSLASAEITYMVVYTIIVIFLWLWLAWACRAGKSWGRMIASVLFGLDTVLMVLTLVTRANAGVLPQLTVGAILGVLTWLAGLGAIVMLWRRESTAYYR